MRAQEARLLAGEHLSAELPVRWQHVQAVAETASRVGATLFDDSDDLVSAAWLHDIGYARRVAKTSFHALDGARYLHGLGIDPVVCSLVAHHSGALFEASERGLLELLAAEFPPAPADLTDALWYCDMQTDPYGEPTTVDERLAEIRKRYGADHVVTWSIDRAELDLIAAVGRAQARLDARGCLLP